MSVHTEPASGRLGIRSLLGQVSGIGHEAPLGLRKLMIGYNAVPCVKQF